ncbi:pyocin knob domain-containing S74 family peptidase [Rahnella aquatilis]|uniref:pyocin knob domain-containing S74 family peptidase n=1 Tax=Rahnella aquatilis TaxID=34038 RepID=UPI003663FBD9
MSAGTIALTNNSANVTGTGTAFTTDLKAGDFIVVIVGGVTYTLGVKTITSATALTLINSYGGPTATGNAWTAVPNATLVGITAQVAADVAKAIRGLNLDKANWQQVFSGTGTITVTLPDGSTYTGPAWNGISTTLAKAYNDGGILNATVTPNSLGNTADFNIYYQTANANAIIANGYPIGKAGTLFVTKSAYGCQQMYFTFQGEAFVRGLTGNFTPAAPNWSDWWPIFTGKSTIPVANGGTGATTPAAAINNLGGFGATAGSFAQGNDSRLNTVNGKTGGAISSNVSIEGTILDLRSNTVTGGWPFLLRFLAGQGNNVPYAQISHENAGNLVISTALSGTAKYFSFLGNGNMQAPGNITCVSLTQTSDETKKDRIEPIENALDKINTLDGVTFLWKDSGIPSAGIIAQQVREVLPEAVSSVFDDHNEYGEVEEEVEVDEEIGGVITKVTKKVTVTKMIRERDDSKRSYTVEYSGVLALAVQAIKELSEKVSVLEAYIGPGKLVAITKEEPTSSS